MIRHGNISVFVPHIGCPNRCSFCNQNTITGSIHIPTYNDVVKAVETAVSHPGYSAENTELAFFGGSFTKIDKSLMEELLSAGKRFVDEKKVCGIRISTRPDGIDEEILKTLESSGVTAIELGCQSMDDRVLSMNYRGHTRADVVKASALIKKFGFSLGLQMMTGLYGDSDAGAIKTAEEIIAINPDTVRIYPTLVLKNTYLNNLFEKGEYHPQTVESAADLVAELLAMFEKTKIKVIRVGLHTVDRDGFVAGPWHPSFGEICQSKVMKNKVLAQIKDKHIAKGNITVFVPKGHLSKMKGVRKSNIEFFGSIGYNCSVFEYSKDTISVIKD